MINYIGAMGMEESRAILAEEKEFGQTTRASSILGPVIFMSIHAIAPLKRYVAKYSLMRT